MEQETVTTNDESPITKEWLIENFGNTMPTEAIILLFCSDDNLTIGEMRKRLREIANAKR